MNKLAIIFLSAALFVATNAREVSPEPRLYFTIPFGPAPTTAAPTTVAGATAAATTAAAGSSVQIVPLGQFLANLFNPSGSGATSIQVQPLFQAIAALFG